MNRQRLFGIHAAQAALSYSADKLIHIWVDRQRQDARLTQLITQLIALNLPIQFVDRQQLSQLAGNSNTQGIVIEIELPRLYNETQLQQRVLALNRPALLLVLDQVQDPHNLGACLRTADAVAADGIIIPKDNACELTPTVCKVASGAAETVAIYQVTNLVRCLRWLKSQNLWIIGSSGEAQTSIFETDWRLPVAVVMGAEGSGMRRLTAEVCDLLVKIPMHGQVESLNVSVAAAVVMYEILRQRSH